MPITATINLLERAAGLSGLAAASQFPWDLRI